MRLERGCLGAVGIAVMLVSAFFVVAALVEWSNGGDGKTSAGVYAGLTVFFGGLLVAGAYLAWRMLWPRRAQAGASGDGDAGESGPFDAAPSPPSEAERERQVLRYAEIEHGRVTVPEVASHCAMTIAEAKVTLDRLVLQEVASIQVTSSGVLVYVFPDVLSDEEKAQATDF
jgi:hypothetical protein